MTAILSQKISFPAFGARKNWMTTISSQRNGFTAIWRRKKVDACYLEHQKCSLQLFEAMKKWMTAISCQKNWFTAIWSTKKMDPTYLVVEKTG